MDVHSTNFTLCSFEPGYGIEADKIFGQIKIKEDIFNSTVKYINKLKSMRPDVDVICGYEAGCLGYNLHRKLKAKEIESVILAPTTMAVSRNSSKKKNDYRDAITIAKCLASSAYKAVYIPDEKDEDIRDFIRMRDDHKTALKQIKQQLNAFCLRHGHHYDKTKWTGLHLNWLRKLELSKVQRETVEEYLATYETLTSKIAFGIMAKLKRGIACLSLLKLNCTSFVFAEAMLKFSVVSRNTRTQIFKKLFDFIESNCCRTSPSKRDLRLLKDLPSLIKKIVSMNNIRVVKNA